MQKLKERKILGTVPKKLQLVETFWDCPEFSKEKNRGITLIALIITIIVMLILVGVTINVALNGGLFKKAEEATILTQIAADKEQLQIEIATAYNEKEREVNFTTLETNLEAKGWTVTISGDEAICTSPKGNTFTVDKNGKITEGEVGSGGGTEPIAFDWGLNVDSKAGYIFEPAEGMTYVMNFTDDGTIKIKYNEEAEQVVDKKDIIKLENDGEGYKVQFHINLSTGEESLESDVKLRMDTTNNEDIIVYVVEHNAEYIYKKIQEKTYPVAYGNYESYMLIETSATTAIISTSPTNKPSKYQIYECYDLTSIPGYENYTVKNGPGISYNKLVAESYKPSGFVYSNIKDSWYICGYRTHTDTQDTTIYEIEILDTLILELNTTVTQEQIDSIIQTANEANGE